MEIHSGGRPPAEPPDTVRLMLRAREINRSGLGSARYRIVADLAAGTASWAAEVAAEVEGEWHRMARRMGAANPGRRCSQRGRLPRGAVVIEVTKPIEDYRDGRASFTVGRVAGSDEEPRLDPAGCEHLHAYREGDAFCHVLVVDGVVREVWS